MRRCLEEMLQQMVSRMPEADCPSVREPLAGPTVGEIGEHALIDQIRTSVPAAPSWLPISIGDDAAVVEPARGTLDVVTTDALVETVHFDLAFTPARDVGFKALAVNLSDLAAMGAAPRVAVLSLVLADWLSVAVVDALVAGLLECAARFGTHLAGGNISRSPGPLVVGVTAIGSVKRRKILTRRGARPGDELFVSGSIGAAAAGLQAFGPAGAIRDPDTVARCGPRYLRPDPRVRLGRLLGQTRTATACIDLSDGLADGVRQLAEASSVGAHIDAGSLPIDPDARYWFERTGRDPVSAAVTGGEDYELLFTVPRKHRGRLAAVRRHIGGLSLTHIGEITAAGDLRLRRGRAEDPLPPGFVHF